MIRKILVSFFLLSLFLGKSEAWDIHIPWISDEQSDQFVVVWGKSMGLLEKALDRLDKSEELPEEKLIGNDKRKNDVKIDRILSDVVEVMSDSAMSDLRDQIVGIRQDLSRRRQNLAELYEKKVAASEEGNFFKDGKGELDEKINEEKSMIKEDGRKLKSLEKKLLSALKERGISASDGQIQSLLTGVTADDIVGMYGVYDNIKLFSNQLSLLMESSGDDVLIARRYYGMYALLIRTCLVMNERFAEKIDNLYLPELNDMGASARILEEDISKQLIDLSLSSVQRDSLISNLESSRMTLSAIEAYRSYLETQRDQSMTRARELGRDYSVAYNAYRTMKLARGFLDLVRSSQQDLNSVTSLAVPDIALFSNDQLKKEFRSITEALR